MREKLLPSAWSMRGKAKETWWRNRYGNVEPDKVSVQKVVGNLIFWLDGKTIKKCQISNGYTSFHKAIKEATEARRERLERSIKQLIACGDDPSKYIEELKKLEEYKNERRKEK